jgi:flagellar hook-length control protein FliK
VAINSNPITAASAQPAPKNFQPRAAGASAATAADDPNPNSAANQAGDASSSNGSGSAQDTAATSTSAAQKTAGPSAQTRGNSRASARTNAAVSAGSPEASDAPDTGADSSSDFGSVMATALGRSTANTPAASASAHTASAQGGTPTTSTATQPGANPAGAGTDAIAWIAQALMPPATPTVAATTDEPATAAGESSANLTSASLARFNATGAPQAPLPQTDDPQAAAANPVTPPASEEINTLADIQKLISGLTGANPTDTDNDSAAPSATPTTHSPVTSDSTEATQAAAALQAAAATRSGGSIGSATLTIHAPVGSAAFADEVGARVAGLGQSGITQAQLQMNPADLGPVQVHITMQSGQASVWFGAAHADTRAALEQSLPRLRELFAGAGMPLTDSGVFREPPQQQSAQSQPSSTGSRLSGSDTASAPTVTQVSNIRLALLDTYA